ncbi:MAG: trypsin-like peptidase domain-containing protein [Burkholderiaceae bacterium]
MRRAPIYSPSRRRRSGDQTGPVRDGLITAGETARSAEGSDGTGGPRPAASDATAARAASGSDGRPGAVRFAALRAWLARHDRKLLLLGAALMTATALLAYDRWRLLPATPTQDDIDDAVMHTLSKEVLPAQEIRAFQAVIGSVVLVRGDNGEQTATDAGKPRQAPGSDRDRDDKRSERPTDRPFPGDGKNDPRSGPPEVSGIGTGVVLIDRGVILTNMHVVSGAKRITVTFADGTESPARITGLRPEQDLAVLQARTVPEGLRAATVKPSTELQPGERVIAVGFPFGIGPSVSSGIVSGLNREFRSKEGREKLQNLIQFDAAANPGNSGGPLVTMDGSVVGIVTAILNPTEDRVFVGIGFAVPIESAASAAGSSPF